MASITVRNLDEATKAELRVRAARNGRSMEEEVRSILRQAVKGEGPQGFAEGPAAPIKTKSLGELIHDRFAEAGGLDFELPPREPLPPPVDFGK
ncbi:MAG: FitA-like ribbon-helix-helix domain-containing protein [Alphaproteobacteria bacterium]